MVAGAIAGTVRAASLDSFGACHRPLRGVNSPQVEGEGPAAKGMLTKFFSCADAWNARAVEAAEEEEIRKLQLQEGLGPHLSSELRSFVAQAMLRRSLWKTWLRE